ncbi:hypothetical protein V8C42DRAFT_322400 [Trichoderma barbatum]
MLMAHQSHLSLECALHTLQNSMGSLSLVSAGIALNLPLSLPGKRVLRFCAEIVTGADRCQVRPTRAFARLLYWLLVAHQALFLTILSQIMLLANPQTVRISNWLTGLERKLDLLEKSNHCTMRPNQTKKRNQRKKKKNTQSKHKYRLWLGSHSCFSPSSTIFASAIVGSFGDLISKTGTMLKKPVEAESCFLWSNQIDRAALNQSISKKK